MSLDTSAVPSSDPVSSPAPARPARYNSPSGGGGCWEEWTAPRTIYAVVLSACWILSVVAATEPVWEEFRGPQHVKQTLWQCCYDDDCRWGEYGHIDDCSVAGKYRAGRAFATLVCLFLAVIVIVAIARAMLPNVDLKFGPGSTAGKVYFWTLALTTFFCFLVWPLAFSLYAGPGCNDEASVASLAYSRLGSSGMFFLDVFIVLLVCLVMECVKGKVFGSDRDGADYPSLS